MGMPNGEVLEIPNNGAGVAIVGENVYHTSDLVQAYDFIRDGTDAFTAELFGSVSGKNWTSITTLAASGQGVILNIYHLLKVKCTVGGAIGPVSFLMYHGKS